MTSAWASTGRPLGIWANSGSTVKIAYIVKPQNRAARLVKSTGRRASIRMSTSGCAVRDSTHPHSTRSATPVPSTPSIRGEVHPHERLSVSATSRQISPADRSRAPGMSRDARARVGDGGTATRTSTMATSPITAPTTNSTRHEAWSTISPLITRPRPPPTPSMAEIRPIATPIRRGGISSRMIEKHSGYTAPPTPWIARNTIRDAMSHAKIESTDPRVKIASVTSSMRSLPCWSPRRPSRGVATDALSR